MTDRRAEVVPAEGLLGRHSSVERYVRGPPVYKPPKRGNRNRYPWLTRCAGGALGANVGVRALQPRGLQPRLESNPSIQASERNTIAECGEESEDIESLAELLEQEVSEEEADAKVRAESGDDTLKVLAERSRDRDDTPAETRGEAEDDAPTKVRRDDESGAGSKEDISVEHKKLARKREFDPVLIPGYKWVHGEGFKSEENYPIRVHVCRSNDHPNPDFVFLDTTRFPLPSFYVYDCWFRDLEVKLPFDDFTFSVLWTLNVAPTQLHPNSWVAICKPGYETEEGYSDKQGEAKGKAKWISLFRIRRGNCWSPLRVLIRTSRMGFSEKPRRCDGYSVGDLTPDEREGLSLLRQAPRPIPAKMLIKLSKSPQIALDFIGIMSKVGGDDFDVKSLLKGRARPKAIQAANAGPDAAALPRPSPQDRLPPVSERKKKDKGTKKAPLVPPKRAAEGGEAGEPSAQPEKKLKQTTISEHAPSSGRRNTECLLGVPLLSPRVNAQELVAMDFTSAEGKKAIVELSLGDKLKAIGEMHLKGLALAQSLVKEPARELVTLRGRVNEAEKLTEEILAKNNELIDANKEVLAENASLKHQLEEVTAAAKNVAAEREKINTRLGLSTPSGKPSDDMPDGVDPDEEVTPMAVVGSEGKEKTKTQADDTLAEDTTGDEGQGVEVTGPKDEVAAGGPRKLSLADYVMF
ncbi:hypothetical protein Fmac_029719 [Flemingia macrophylla]|uniref:Uncharacterized protein n=1 Tax=Flemingia macrophylla TaxID=520843 RepID=A0ABD1LCS1_9FABA